MKTVIFKTNTTCFAFRKSYQWPRFCTIIQCGQKVSFQNFSLSCRGWHCEPTRWCIAWLNIESLANCCHNIHCLYPSLACRLYSMAVALSLSWTQHQVIDLKSTNRQWRFVMYWFANKDWPKPKSYIHSPNLSASGSRQNRDPLQDLKIKDRAFGFE